VNLKVVETQNSSNPLPQQRFFIQTASAIYNHHIS